MKVNFNIVAGVLALGLGVAGMQEVQGMAYFGCMEVLGDQSFAELLESINQSVEKYVEQRPGASEAEIEAWIFVIFSHLLPPQAEDGDVRTLPKGKRSAPDSDTHEETGTSAGDADRRVVRRIIRRRLAHAAPAAPAMSMGIDDADGMEK